jgi:nitrogen regulatory protein PII
MNCNNKNFELIVVIVNRGFAEDIIDAAIAAGAEGCTIINGRGTGIHENTKLFNMLIEPEKEIVLILVPIELTEKVLEAVRIAGNLDKPQKGVAFVLAVSKVAGICHLWQD